MTATDGFLPIDAALWSIAAALLAYCLWLVRRDAATDGWDPAVFFGGALVATFGRGQLPLAEGPVPAGGWDGAADDLPDEYAPEARLGAGATWAGLAADDAATRAALARRLDGLKLVWLEPPTVEVDGLAPTVTTVEGIPALLPRPEDRFVLAASREAMAALRALADAPALRDRLRAVLLVAPTLDPAWLAEGFTQKAFDVEVAREVPYLTLRAGPDAAAQRLPDPAPTASGFTPVAVVDLGVLPPDLVADPRVARALGALVAALG